MYLSRRQKAILEKSATAFAIIIIVYLCILFPLVVGAQEPVCTTIPEPMCISAISTPAPIATPQYAWKSQNQTRSFASDRSQT